MNILESSFKNIGNIMYLDDVLVLTSSTSSATATSFVSVDSRFTISAMGLTSGYTNYNVDITNCNPFIKIDPYNQNMFNPAERVIANPDFNNSWCNIGNLGASGTFEGNGFYRFVRISNVSGINTSFKAFIFTEKQMPVIQ